MSECGLPYHRRGRRSRGADPEACGRRASGRGLSPSVSGRHRRRRRRLRRPARGPTCSARPGTSRPRACRRPTSLSVAAPAIGPGAAARYRPNARAHPPAPATTHAGDRARHPPAEPRRESRQGGSRQRPGGIRPARVSPSSRNFFSLVFFALQKKILGV